MFTVEQRDALRDRVLTLADEDHRVVAGAAIGSLAFGGGDRFSDLDLTFAIADDVSVAAVLDDWTRTLTNDEAALQLVDLERGPTVYRVFLLPDGLQFVIYGLHSHTCIERGRVWQAEHYIGAVRDHALSLACLRRELPAVQARGYDDLPADTLAGFAGTHVDSLEPQGLSLALSAAMRALLHEAKQNNVPSVDAVAERLSELP